MTYSLTGAGVIGDITTQARRRIWLLYKWTLGKYPFPCALTPFSVGLTQVGPVLGPVIGGVLADKLGWR